MNRLMPRVGFTGDAVCVNNDGYRFALSRTYHIKRVEEGILEGYENAFAIVIDDSGREVACHARRFRILSIEEDQI